MGKKLISIFLFMLFCIVLAFPGYGRNASVKPNRTNTPAQIKSAEPQEFTIINLVKKCLSKGISIVEEERPVEESQNETEDEHSVGAEESLLIGHEISIQHPVVSAVKYYHSNNFVKTISLRGVPEPPPECIL